MNKYKTELKWAIIFTIVALLWMLLEKLSGLHGKYIDYHLYLTNLFAIPAIWMMVLSLKEKKKQFYNGQITMPLADAFWGAYFGMLTDQFGIGWMINVTEKQ